MQKNWAKRASKWVFVGGALKAPPPTQRQRQQQKCYKNFFRISIEIDKNNIYLKVWYF